jgi:hypothetical protein
VFIIIIIIIIMELDGINGELAAQEVIQKKTMEEIEKVDEFDIAKNGNQAINPEEERRLVRKLDLWYARIDCRG